MSNKTKGIDLTEEQHKIAERYMLLTHKLNDEKNGIYPYLLKHTI